MDYSFMKSGLLDDTPTSLENLQFDLVSLYLRMVSLAAENAMLYSEHEGRDSVSKNDVIMALRHQARYFLQRTDNDTLQEARKDLENILEHDDEEGCDDDDFMCEDEEPKECGTCDCDVCSEIREVSEQWEEWDTQGDVVLEYLKQQVDKVANM